MANLTIKGMDDTLYNDLKASAERHHRSIASEATAIIERALRSERLSEEQVLDLARRSRARVTGPGLTMDEIIAAIKEGRKYE